jgi:hypothetical protein
MSVLAETCSISCHQACYVQADVVKAHNMCDSAVVYAAASKQWCFSANNAASSYTCFLKLFNTAVVSGEQCGCLWEATLVIWWYSFWELLL